MPGEAGRLLAPLPENCDEVYNITKSHIKTGVNPYVQIFERISTCHCFRVSEMHFGDHDDSNTDFDRIIIQLLFLVPTSI
jgi:hypothetical protein